MDEKMEWERRLTTAEDRSRDNQRRLADVERKQNILEELVGSVRILAIRQETVESDVKEIKNEVKELTGKPGKRWENIVDKVLMTIIGAVLLFILAKIGF